MAFALIDLCLVHRLKTQGYLPPGGAVMEIGAQQLAESILSNSSEVENLARAFGADTAYVPSASSHASSENLLAGAPLARDMWQWLGLEYASIDIDGTPGSIPLDLNCDAVPKEAKSKYRLVTNLGTTEHVANQLNAFKIIHDLTAVEGVMVHNLPCYWPDHGLVGYNPNFFWALARSNGYKLIYIDLLVASDSDFAAEHKNVVATFSTEIPNFAEKWRRYELPPCSIHVALLKQFDLDFVAPVDVPSAASAADPAMRRRYWSVFDRRAFDKITQSRTRAVFDREQAAAVAEEDIERRKHEVYDREQKVAAREETAKRAAFDREQRAAIREEAAEMREHAAFDREQRVAIREEAATMREHALLDREHRAAIREEAATMRQHALLDREHRTALREETAQAREAAVFDREQAVCDREARVTRREKALSPFARLRRTIVGHAPWLVEIKRRVHGQSKR